MRRAIDIEKEPAADLLWCFEIWRFEDAPERENALSKSSADRFVRELCLWERETPCAHREQWKSISGTFVFPPALWSNFKG